MSGFKKSKGGNYNRPNMAKDGSGDDSRSRAELGADPSVDGTYRAYFAGKIGKVDKQRGPVSQFSNNDDYNHNIIANNMHDSINNGVVKEVEVEVEVERERERELELIKVYSHQQSLDTNTNDLHTSISMSMSTSPLTNPLR